MFGLQRDKFLKSDDNYKHHLRVVGQILLGKAAGTG